MAACLVAHGDDGVYAARFQPARLFHRGGGGDDLRPRGLHAGLQLRRGQPEVKAHHLRPQFLNQRARCLVKRRAVCGRRLRIQVDTELGVVRRQMGSPSGIALGIRLRRRVAEEVQVDGATHGRPKLPDLLPDLFDAEHRTRQRTKPAATRHGNRQLHARHPRHRPQYDGHFDIEQRQHACIGPCAHDHLRQVTWIRHGNAAAFHRIDPLKHACNA